MSPWGQNRKSSVGLGMSVVGGRADFDFFGYHVGPEGLPLVAKTIEQFVARAIRLYEQDRKEPLSPSRLDRYVRRWVGWAGAALPPEATTGLPAHYVVPPVPLAPSRITNEGGSHVVGGHGGDTLTQTLSQPLLTI